MLAGAKKKLTFVGTYNAGWQAELIYTQKGCAKIGCAVALCGKVWIVYDLNLARRAMKARRFLCCGSARCDTRGSGSA